MKEIFIERSRDLLRIAVKEKDELKECFIEQETGEPYPGEIYKGIVKNIVPAIKSAFIDIGHKKNVYMYLDSKFKNINLKKGEEILVQVIKEDLGSKGAKVTNVVSVPGKYCVLDNFNKDIRFSKKIQDKSMKESVSRGLNKPKEVGIMVRTSAEGIPVEVINDEINRLYEIYKDINIKSQYSGKPGLLFDNGGILGRVLRDKLNGNNFKIYVNTKEDNDHVEDFLRNIPNIRVNLRLHEGERTLFNYYGIEKEILGLRNNRVFLNCGGHIVIDRTEAMYVIDVNSGKNVKSNSMEKTVFVTNYQAAEEIARQIRLRNLSGIILVDFIDMYNEENRNKILDKLNEGFTEDKNKTVVYPFTELNLVQIARKRSGKSIYEYIEEDCGCCSGKGKRIKLSYIAMLIKNEIIRINEQRDIKDIHIQMDEAYRVDIEEDVLSFIKAIGALNKKIYITYLKDEHFKVEPLMFMNQIENLQIFKVYG